MTETARCNDGAARRARFGVVRAGFVGLVALALVGSSACAGAAKNATSKKTASKPSATAAGAKATTTKVGTKPASGVALTADQVVPVAFDSPGANPRPINETTVAVKAPVSVLKMNVTGISYRGLVCGFSFRAVPPTGPVTIRMKGESPSTTFDSGPLALSWTGLDSHLVKADSGSDHGWSFSSEAHVNRTGPGWVISLGGVTAEGTDVVPFAATCELTLTTPLTAANGPIGYWAGFATV